MKPLELLDCQPNNIGIDGYLQVSSHGERRLCRRRPSVTLIPNQGGGLIEAMRFVPLHVVHQSFAVQLADHEIVGSGLRKRGIIFHSEVRLDLC
jgi:hypothetical protein